MVDRWDRAAHLGAGLGLAAVLAACAGGAVSPAPPGTPASPEGSGVPAARQPATSTDAPTADPTSAPATTAPTAALPGSPPAATLGGLAGGGTAVGALGSFTWAGGGSDAPWIIGKAAGSVRPGATLRVTFTGLVPASWTAAWAKVVDGTAASPTGGTTGSSDVTLRAPSKAGPWSVRVTGSFGPGANATYYWRVTVAP